MGATSPTAPTASFHISCAYEQQYSLFGEQKKKKKKLAILVMCSSEFGRSAIPFNHLQGGLILNSFFGQLEC